MTNHTRRQFLGLVASLLTLLDAVRRFFKPPEVVKDHIDDWPAPNTGPYFDYMDDPLIRKRAMLKLLQEKGCIQLNCTGPDIKDWFA